MEATRSCSQRLQDVDIVITVICGQPRFVLDMIVLGRENGCGLSLHSEFEETKETPGFNNGQEQTKLTKAHTDRVTLKSCHLKYLSCNCKKQKCSSNHFSVSMDTMVASCLTTELKRSRHFEESFRNFLENLQMKRTSERVSAERKKENRWTEGEHLTAVQCCSPCLRLQLRLQKTQTFFKMEPDIRWSNYMLPQLMQRIQMEDAFSWLSTLGGAYSSLGDNIYNCAIEAGRVALRQLYLAECLGDAMLRSRCLLYIALSLMQRGRLSAAKKLIRQQYRFATSKTACSDTRLVSMCQGIWHHLRHHYAKRKET